MRALIGFIKKEWLESLANFKLVILVGVFAVLGIMNVFTAKFTPQLISKLVSEELAQSFPEPSVIDVWVQFFKNTGQMGLIILVILFSGLLTQEYQKDTLTILVTKGLSRWKIIIGKLVLSSFLFSLAYWLSVGLTYLYSFFYFDDVNVPYLLPAVSFLWLFGLFLLISSLLAGALLTNNYSVLLFNGGLFISLLIANIFPKLANYNPLMLATSNLVLMEKMVVIKDFYPPIIVMTALSIVMLSLSIARFNKKAL